LLVVFDAPLWSFYVAPILGIPALIRLLYLRDGADPDTPPMLAKPQHPSSTKPTSVLREQFGSLAAMTVRGIDFAQYVLGTVLVVGVTAAILVPTSSDSQSSPLFPILVAIVILLAVSLAVVYIRAHRDREITWRWVVIPVDGGWVVRTDDHVSSRHGTREEDTRAAREHLREEGGGELVVQDPDGRIRDKNTIHPKSRIRRMRRA